MNMELHEILQEERFNKELKDDFNKGELSYPVECKVLDLRPSINQSKLEFIREIKSDSHQSHHQ